MWGWQMKWLTPKCSFVTGLGMPTSSIQNAAPWVTPMAMRSFSWSPQWPRGLFLGPFLHWNPGGLFVPHGTSSLARITHFSHFCARIHGGGEGEPFPPHCMRLKEHKPVQRASGILELKEMGKKKWFNLPQLRRRLDKKGEDPMEHPTLRNPTCRNPRVGRLSFSSISQMRMLRREMSPCTLASSSSCLLSTALSSSPSRARSITSFSFRKRRS